MSPTCPRCGAPMVPKSVKGGLKPGSQFWGCTRFPHCRGSRLLTTSDMTRPDLATNRSAHRARADQYDIRPAPVFYYAKGYGTGYSRGFFEGYKIGFRKAKTNTQSLFELIADAYERGKADGYQIGYDHGYHRKPSEYLSDVPPSDSDGHVLTYDTYYGESEHIDYDEGEASGYDDTQALFNEGHAGYGNLPTIYEDNEEDFECDCGSDILGYLISVVDEGLLDGINDPYDPENLGFDDHDEYSQFAGNHYLDTMVLRDYQRRLLESKW